MAAKQAAVAQGTLVCHFGLVVPVLKAFLWRALSVSPSFCQSWFKKLSMLVPHPLLSAIG